MVCHPDRSKFYYKRLIGMINGFEQVINYQDSKRICMDFLQLDQIQREKNKYCFFSTVQTGLNSHHNLPPFRNQED